MKALVAISGFALTDLLAAAIATVAITFTGITSPFIAVAIALTASSSFAYLFHLIIEKEI